MQCIFMPPPALGAARAHAVGRRQLQGKRHALCPVLCGAPLFEALRGAAQLGALHKVRAPAHREPQLAQPPLQQPQGGAGGGGVYI